jgi:hypothetical protein
MGMPFEYFVRPFQAPDSQGRIIIPSTPSGHERATLTWGAKTSSLPAVEKTGTSVDCCSEHLDEVERTTERVKIIDQVNSPENYMIVERATNVKLRKKHEDKCAADWNQMSGVASAINGAFASLEADIEAEGSGATIDHCHQVLQLQPNTVQASKDPRLP